VRPPSAELSSLRRRLAPAVLLVGAVAVGFLVKPALPEDRGVELRLADRTALEEVELVWLDEDHEAIRRTVLSFRDRPVPAKIATEVRVPDGDYRLLVTLRRDGGTQELERRISFRDSDRVVVPLD
jgi:hypothetical protein